MASAQTGVAWHQIRRLFGLGTLAGMSERELLDRYASRGDEAAFAALVSLHGAMVAGVCRRMLADRADGDDAFQATFLVLVRKARSLGPHESVGPWLYGVACRVALRARSEAAKRRSRERSGTEVDDVATIDDDNSSAEAELGEVLDEELKALPGSYRAAVVLCYLEGRTHEEAARQLGWPVGTVKGRLSRARDLLRGRLARRGLAPSAAALASFFAKEASASAPSAWVESTIKVATRVAAGEMAAGVVSASVASLAEGAIRTMKFSQWKMLATALVAFTSVAVATAVAQLPGLRGGDVQKAAVPDPGPASAAPIEKAGRALDPVKAVGPAYRPDPKLANLRPREDNVDPLAKAQEVARSRAIHKQLGEKLILSFPTDTPLEDFLKYVRQNTQSEELDLPQGIPIYVDPIGLQEADKTMASTVAIDLEGVPLRRTLQLALKQLGLCYYVTDDGLMVITSTESANNEFALPFRNGPSPMSLMRSKAERGEMTAPELKEFIEMLKDLKTIDELIHPKSTLPGQTTQKPKVN